jgi:CRP/FNR family transcriptional regulator
VKREQIAARDNRQVSTTARPSASRLPCDSCASRCLGICHPLDDRGLETLVSLGGRRRWRKREMIYRANDDVHMFYKITKGFVAESRTLDDGRRQIVGIRTVGDLCGYPLHLGTHLFTAEALTDVEACAFERHKLEAFIARQPDVAGALAEEISRRLRRATENMTVIGQLKSTERVAHFIIEMDELNAVHQVGTHPLVLHLTRHEIADYLGLTLETVSRAFSKLKDMHVIALVGGDSVAILSEQRLADIAKVS